MAPPLTKADLQALPVRSYAEIRPQLSTGDLLFASGNYKISQLIQHGTGSPWSHVGMIVVADAISRVLLLESVETYGVRLAPLSKYLIDYDDGKPYDGEVVLAHFTGRVDAVAAASAGIDELTRPYNSNEYTDLLYRVIMKVPRPITELNHIYVCSELVQYCFSRGGYTFVNNPLGFISPEDIFINPGVELARRIE